MGFIVIVLDQQTAVKINTTDGNGPHSEDFVPVAAAATVLTRKKKQGQITALSSYYCAGSHSTPELTLMRDDGS